MNLYFRLLRAYLYGLLGRGLQPTDAAESRFRVWFNDLDAFGHMNNGRYLQIMDVARTEWMTRVGVIVAWNDRAIAIDPEDPTTRYNIACFYAQVGEIDKAFEYLENTITSRSWAENDPELEPLHADPRFKALMERLQAG